MACRRVWICSTASRWLSGSVHFLSPLQSVVLLVQSQLLLFLLTSSFGKPWSSVSLAVSLGPLGYLEGIFSSSLPVARLCSRPAGSRGQMYPQTQGSEENQKVLCWPPLVPLLSNQCPGECTLNSHSGLCLALCHLHKGNRTSHHPLLSVLSSSSPPIL